MTIRTGLAIVLGCALLCVTAAAVAGSRDAQAEPAPRPAQPAARSPFKSVETKDLHNAHRVTDNLISGAAPDSEQAFKDLKSLGVKTIVSVDGAVPDVETARRFGMRYVHLPIGYDDVAEAEGKQIAKALTELPGPIYLHCHHGKHRSAAAVAVACVMNGALEPGQAESVLKTFGTGENYLGLWNSARRARPLAAASLAAVRVDYVERAQIPELAERMVELDKTWERLTAIRKNGWKAPGDHPDLDPAHEALQLEEHFRETGRAEHAAARRVEFRQLLAEGESGVAALRKALSADPIAPPAAEAAFATVSNSCTACHKSHRD